MFEMEDVGSTLLNNNQDPTEAASELQKAKELNVHPETYRAMKETYDGELQNKGVPLKATRTVASKVQESEQMAAMMKPEVSGLSWIEANWELGAQKIKGVDISREMDDLDYKRSTGQSLTDDEFVRYDELIATQQSIPSAKDLGFDEDEDNWFNFDTLLPDVVSTGYDFSQTLWEGRGISLLGAAIGGTAGGVLGLLGGPVGAALGAKGGAIAGASLFTTFGTIPWDTYTRTRGGLYRELGQTKLITSMSNPKEAERTRQEISGSLAMLSAATELIPIGVLTKRIPFLKKILRPSSVVKQIDGPAGHKLVQVLKDIGAGMAAEGSQEVLQETIQVFGENLGETWDGEETSFIDAVGEAWTLTNAKRLTSTGLRGGVAGGAFTAAGKAVSPVVETVLYAPDKAVARARQNKAKTAAAEASAPLPETNPDIPQAVKSEPLVDATQVKTLQFSEMIRNISQKSQSTELAKLAPDQLKDLQRKIGERLKTDHVWLDPADLNEWADTPDKVAAVEQMLEGADTAEAAANVPLKVSIERFIELVDVSPDASRLVKMAPDTPSARGIMKSFVEAQQQETTVQETPKQETYFEVDSQGRPVKEVPLTSWVNKEPVTTPEALGDVMSNFADEVAALRDILFDENNELSLSNTDFADPKWIEAEWINRLIEEKRKVLPKDGVTIEEAAKQNKINFSDIIDAILNVQQVTTPDKTVAEPEAQVIQFGDYKNDQVERARMKVLTELDKPESVDSAEVIDFEQVRQAKMEQVESGAEPTAPVTTNEKLDAAYNDTLKAHIGDLKRLVKERKAATKVPIEGDVKLEAERKVNATKVRDLNATKYDVGELRSHQDASSVKFNTYGKIRSKRNAIENIALAKESRKATRKVNQTYRLIANLYDPQTQRYLKEAGKVYSDAAQSVLKMFGFEKSDAFTANPEALSKFIKKMNDERKAENKFDEAFIADLQAVQDPRDLTVAQTTFVGDLLKGIVHQAMNQNRLLKSALGVELNSLDLIGHEVLLHTKATNLEYNESKLTEPEGDETVRSWLLKASRNVDAFTKNLQFTALQLDNGVVQGYFAKLLYTPLVKGLKLKGKYQQAFRKNFDAKIKKHYRSSLKFKMQLETSVRVPEFEGNSGLNNGRLTKADLILLLANMGNAYNKSRIGNFNIDPDIVMAVLQRELSKNDFDFVQEAIWNNFVKVAPDLVKVEAQTTGVELELVEAQSFTAFDKTYPGGYFPVIYKSGSAIEALLKDNTADAIMNNSSPIFPESFREGIVRSPHTKERTGSDWQLSLDFNNISIGFEQIFHDIAMRVPVRDTINVLKNGDIQQAMKGVIGTQGYQAVVDAILAQTHSASVRNLRLYSNLQKAVAGVTNHLESGAAVAWITYRFSSFFMSFKAYPNIITKMGANNARKYLAKAALQVTSPGNFINGNDLRELAREIDPTIDAHRAGMDEYRGTSGIEKHFAKRRQFLKFMSTKPGVLIDHTLDSSVDFAFNGILGAIDNTTKTITAVAAYMQFIDGEAPGHSLDSVSKMTQKELHEAAVNYAEQFTSAVTLRAEDISKAPIQKMELVKHFTKFWNEPRNVFLSTRQYARDVKRDSKFMVDAFKDGDIEAANKYFYGTTAQIQRVIIGAVMGLAITNLARGIVFDEDEEENGKQFAPKLDNLVETINDPERVGKWMVSKVTTLGGAGDIAGELLFGVAPIVRDGIFSVETGKSFAIPLMTIASDISTGTWHLTKNTMDLLAGDIAMQDFFDEFDPNNREARAFYNSLGYLGKNLSVGAMIDLYKGLTSEESSLGVDDIPGSISRSANMLLAMIDQYILKNTGKDAKELTDEEFMELEMQRFNEEMTPQQTYIEQLNSIREQLVPSQRSIPKEFFDVLKYAESGGDKFARASRSSAYGLYQFIPSTWERIMNTPEGRQAGLTRDGRISGNTSQQEIAIRILTKMNALDLLKRNVPLSAESLYFAHHFGTEHAAEMFRKPDNHVLSRGKKGLLSNSVLKANPKLVERNVRTVGDLKEYLRFVLNRGIEMARDNEEITLTLN